MEPQKYLGKEKRGKVVIKGEKYRKKERKKKINIDYILKDETENEKVQY